MVFPTGKTVDESLPRLGFGKAHQMAHGGAFPRTVGPQKTENLAFMYSKGNVVDTTPVSVILGKAFDFNFLQVNRSFRFLICFLITDSIVRLRYLRDDKKLFAKY